MVTVVSVASAAAAVAVIRLCVVVVRFANSLSLYYFAFGMVFVAIITR